MLDLTVELPEWLRDGGKEQMRLRLFASVSGLDAHRAHSSLRNFDGDHSLCLVLIELHALSFIVAVGGQIHFVDSFNIFNSFHFNEPSVQNRSKNRMPHLFSVCVLPSLRISAGQDAGVKLAILEPQTIRFRLDNLVWKSQPDLLQDSLSMFHQRLHALPVLLCGVFYLCAID
jgi:hypothetical protein